MKMKTVLLAIVAMLNAGNTYASDCPKELYEAPNVHAKRPADGYSFVTTACDFAIKNSKGAGLVKVE